VSTPKTWHDITNEVEVDDPPFTLAKEDGFGALQFSVALYSGGSMPNPSSQDLIDMVVEFGKSHRMGKGQDVTQESGDVPLAAATFLSKEDTVRVWYISDGKNFAFITYTCESRLVNDEIQECEAIVRSIRFAA
jgi:hypothetical protein